MMAGYGWDTGVPFLRGANILPPWETRHIYRGIRVLFGSPVPTTPFAHWTRLILFFVLPLPFPCHIGLFLVFPHQTLTGAT